MKSESSKQGDVEIFLDGQYLGLGTASVTHDFDHTGPGFGPPKSALALLPPRLKLNITMTNRYRSIPVEESAKAAKAAWERIQHTFQVGVDPAKADETSKTVSKDDERLEPGIGYRFLDKEELVVEGDEFWSQSAKKWFATPQRSEDADRAQWNNTTYRRRNQFAEGELVQIIKPATQALRDREPKWRDAMDHLDGKVLEMPNVVWCDGWRSIPLFRRGSCTHFQPVHLNWLAPASSKQKAAFQAEKDKKAKVQELEDKMKAIESELASLKGT